MGAGGCQAAGETALEQREQAGEYQAMEETALEQRAQVGTVPTQREPPAETPVAEVAGHGEGAVTSVERWVFAVQ